MTARRIFFALGLLCAGLWLLASASQNIFGNPLFPPAAGHPPVAFISGLALCFFGYVLLFRLFGNKKKIHPAVIFGGALLLAMPMFFVQELNNSDTAYYFFLGDMQTRGGNPYVATTFASYEASPFLQSFQAEIGKYYFLPTAYGPAWMVGMHGLIRLAGPSFATAVSILRSLVLAVFCGMIVLLMRMRLQQNHILLFAWNPLVFVFGIANVHNDFLLALLLLGSFLAFRRQRWLVSLMLLVLAVAVKWIAVVVLPLYFFALLRHVLEQRAWKTFALACGTSIALVLVLWAPFGLTTNIASGLGVQATYSNFTVFQSQADLLTTPPTRVFHESELRQEIGEFFRSHNTDLTRFAGFGGFAILFFWVSVRLYRRQLQYEDAALLVLFAFLVLALSWYVYWYWLWLLPFLALGRAPRLVAGASLVPFVAGFHDLQLHLVVLLAGASLWYIVRTIRWRGPMTQKTV